MQGEGAVRKPFEALCAVALPWDCSVRASGAWARIYALWVLGALIVRRSGLERMFLEEAGRANNGSWRACEAEQARRTARWEGRARDSGRGAQG